LLEAAACGLPIIATQVGGNSEIVQEHVNGCLVPVGAPEQIAARALELLRNCALRAAWGEASRRRVEESFSLDRMVRNHEALYERLLNRRTNH
jgi:glycosyltransferase involved in cell wall biosynthesis